MIRIAAGVAVLAALVASRAGAQLPATGAVLGTVVADDGRPVVGASVSVGQPESRPTAEVVTDARGAFHIAPLAAGTYAITVRHPSYSEAQLVAVRVVGGDTTTVRVTLTRAATQLSTVIVAQTPTSMDALAPETPRRIERGTTLQLPTPRDASALVALVPGAKDGRLWGGAGAATNDFRLDGISMNHPGAGGDFLRLPRDWVETIEIRGIGANAEFGNFQGGVINAVTRTGTNSRTATARSFHESERLTASNFGLDEQGSELASRTELGADASGPVIRDRLFYLVGAQMVDRTFRSPDLASAAPSDFLEARERQRELRGLGKLTWRRPAGERLDLLLGFTEQRTEHAGINGLDDAAALPRVRAPTLWYEVAWRRDLSSRSSLELKLAGYDAHETRRGTRGASVPAVRVLTAGDLPRYQNAEFDERRDPASLSTSLIGRQYRRVLGADHQFAMGAEATMGSWRDERIRNGGLTWRPYVAGTTSFSPSDASTWSTTGSDWGGETRLQGRTTSAAVFVQDQVTMGSRLSISPGIRLSRWTGWLTACDAAASDPACDGRLRAAEATGVDPRIGLSWDVTGRNTLAVRAHWGRYHQGMYAQLFDRAAGANAYTNQRFYYSAPPLTDSRTTFTAGERDALLGPSGFSPFHDEQVLNESGSSSAYRQPFVDQASLGAEKTLGTHWKIELLGVVRRNGDIVGLVDRNMASNYTLLRNIDVGHRLGFGPILDAQGRPLRLEGLWVNNRDLADAVRILNANVRNPLFPNFFGGWGVNDIDTLGFDPRLELAPIPEAHRQYRQLTVTATADYPRWRAEGSVTVARLDGNVAGVTSHGVVGTRFTAGPFARPNESTNADGALPDATEFEAKLWLTARLPLGLEGGLLYVHILGERMTPSFTLLGRYAYTDSSGQRAPDVIVRAVQGQQVFIEPRGSRHYASRGLLDLHLERALIGRGATRAVLSVDVFNVLGSGALLQVKTDIDDQAISDPSSLLGAPRQRVAPRSLRLGVRIE